MNEEIKKQWGKYFQPLKEKLSARDDIDMDLVEKAYFFSADAHKDQKRKTGEPYITHPVAVAELVLDYEGDEESVISALLHDTVEDTPVELSDINPLFGDQVSLIVEGLTKINKANYEGSKEDWGVDNFIKFILSSSQDLRIIFVKILDRIHNLETIGSFRKEKQERISNDTLEVYVPIANLLGAWRLMSRMEEKILPILFPNESSLIQEYRKTEKRALLDEICETLNSQHETIHTYSYERRGFSILQYLQNGIKLTPENIFPYGIKIIVEDKKEGYGLLSELHSFGIPQFSDIKDYIACPKSNGYQAFHTALILENGAYVHVEILEKKHAQKAELGFFFGIEFESSFSNILKEILTYKNLSTNNKFFLEAIKNNLLQKEIHVYSDEGKVIKLPNQSTVIDFAYTAFPEKAHGAVDFFIDGKNVDFWHILTGGEKVKIIFQKNKTPNIRWIKSAKTTRARQSLLQYFNDVSSRELIMYGEKILKTNIIRYYGYVPDDISEKILQHYSDTESFFRNIGTRDISPLDFLTTLFSEKELLFSPFHLRFPDRNSGVHRLILEVVSVDRKGLLADIMATLNLQNTNVLDSTFFVNEKSESVCKLGVEVNSFTQLYDVVESIKKIRGVLSIHKK